MKNKWLCSNVLPRYNKSIHNSTMKQDFDTINNIFKAKPLSKHTEVMDNTIGKVSERKLKWLQP
jgi:hypothetical protein